MPLKKAKPAKKSTTNKTIAKKDTGKSVFGVKKVKVNIRSQQIKIRDNALDLSAMVVPAPELDESTMGSSSQGSGGDKNTLERPMSLTEKFFRKKKEEIEAEKIASIEKGVPSEKTQVVEPKSKSIHMYKKIAFNFSIFTVILILVVSYFAFVNLTIIIKPNEEVVSDNLIVDVYDRDNEENVQNRSIAGIVKTVDLSTEKTYAVSGEEVTGEEVIGRVTITNQSNKNQPLVASTRLLSSDNKLFRVKETINVPAEASIDVDIYADQVSAEMAIDPSHFTIPGLWSGLQDQIYADSKEAFVYQNKSRHFVRQLDFDKAVADLDIELRAKAEKDFAEMYPDFDKILFQIDDTLVRHEFSAKLDEEIPEFSAKAIGTVNVVAFSTNDVQNMVEDKIYLIVPDTKELTNFNKKDMGYSIEKFSSDDSLASINVAFTGKMMIKNGSDLIDRSQVVGLTKAQLENYLAGFKEISSYEIQFSPNFISKAPSLVDRIKIEVKK